MLLIPAIDLKDGQCVRLRQGKMEDNTVFSDDELAEIVAAWSTLGEPIRDGLLALVRSQPAPKKHV